MPVTQKRAVFSFPLRALYILQMESAAHRYCPGHCHWKAALSFLVSFHAIPCVKPSLGHVKKTRILLTWRPLTKLFIPLSRQFLNAALCYRYLWNYFVPIIDCELSGGKTNLLTFLTPKGPNTMPGVQWVPVLYLMKWQDWEILGVNSSHLEPAHREQIRNWRHIPLWSNQRLSSNRGEKVKGH